jgi:hypothetical protein
MLKKVQNWIKALMPRLRQYAVIRRFRAEQKRNDIEMKYKYMFELLDLDWYGYLELQRMKKKELSENGL